MSKITNLVERKRKADAVAEVDDRGKATAAGARRKGECQRERLLDAQEAATMLGLALGTIRNMTSRGELGCVKVGKHAVRYRESYLMRWIEAHEVGARY